MALATVAPVTAKPLPLGRQLRITATSRSTRVHEWPQVMRGDLAWDQSSLPSEEDTILSLNTDEIAEVKAAVEYFNGESRPASTLPRTV
jgi:hypothetical protein